MNGGSIAGWGLLIAGFLISACATGMSEEDCLVADWGAIGYADGLDGSPLSQFETRSGQCAEFGIGANRQAYAQARDVALREFCTPMSGLEFGKRGGTYHNVCTPNEEIGFLETFAMGRRYYDLKSDYEDAENDYRNAVSEENRLVDRYNELVDKIRNAATPEDREGLEGKLADVRERLDDARSDIPLEEMAAQNAASRFYAFEAEFFAFEQFIRSEHAAWMASQVE